MLITLILHRIDQPPREFQEGFVSEDETCLRTLSVVPAQFSEKWSRQWQASGALAAGQVITRVRKHLFFHEYFGILEVRGAADELLGYYTDICTPLVKTAAGYAYTDLLLDLYLWPDGRYKILDEAEFEAAVAAGKLAPEWETQARATLARLVREAQAGVFPQRYLPAQPV